ncbi:MAG TPA: hypothetical protein VF759_12700 [Allosphingosinicella sp.]|jgi:hypothetical protein
MISDAFVRGAFPSRDGMIRGTWVPIFFQPNPDSLERFVIGVTAWDGQKHFLAVANVQRRLRCLFGKEAEIAELAIRVGLDSLREQISRRGPEALDNGNLVSGVRYGSPEKGEAVSVEELAWRALEGTAVLHDGRPRMTHVGAVMSDEDHEERLLRKRIVNDRLPILVMKELSREKPAFENSFNTNIRRSDSRAIRIRPQEVYIAYSSNRLVANFATLPSSQPARAVDVVKRLMWDLEQDAKRETGRLDSRSHEMIVFHRSLADPEMTEAQYQRVQTVVEELTDQAHSGGLELVSRDSVPAIAQHIIDTEIPRRLPLH